MVKEGKYIYCIIISSEERNFGPIGIGGRGDEIMTISYDNLSMVVSNHPLAKFVLNPENILAHEKVIEEVMKEYPCVLPVKFGTIASNADEIRNLLDRRYREFMDHLSYVENKIELNVKAEWKNMELIFNELTNESKQISELRQKIESSVEGESTDIKVELGKCVKQELLEKKEDEAETILNPLKRAAVDYKINRTTGDAMLLNAAFLVDTGREKEFDNILDDFSEEFEDRIHFNYSGPFPAYNFVDVAIYPEDWEL